jgi:ParB-like chromosome segregation protein Spo0J
MGMVPSDEIEAVVAEGEISEDEIEMVQLSLGLTNQKLNPIEAGGRIVRRMDRDKLSAAEAAEQLGVAEGTLCKYVSIFKQIAPQLHDEVRSGDIPFTIAYQLSRLKDRHERQVQIADSWKNNVINRQGVTDAVNADLGDGKKGRCRPVVVVDGEATAKFPDAWTWDQIAQWFSKVVEAAKRGAKMPGAPTAYLQGLLKSA